ncbi:MAG: sensor histidine kinase [Porphyromonadaceae bacterium]|nr:MAG: sensor histidine kinase [Porphyromonadaceae bacterium]
MNNQIDLLEKVKPALEDANHLFPNYLSGLSHDIRTPLSAIIGFSDLLAEPRVSRTDQRSYCLMIARSSRKLLDLMSNLIDLAKMETGNLELFYKNVYFKDLVDELKIEMDEMSALYEKNHLAISYIAPPDALAKVFTDKGRLFQIIKILMENSLRFTKLGSIDLVIKQTSPSNCTIEVNDTGCGIDKETLRNLFEMFPPADTPLGKKMKARGMSLSVVKKLCDMMDIFIEVSSQIGVGTMVRLTIPGRAL